MNMEQFKEYLANLQDEEISEDTIKEITDKAPKDEKNRPIIPDDFFDKNIKILPNGCITEDGQWRSYNKGKLVILGTNKDRDKAIQSEGGKAIQATIRERRTMAEQINIYLAKKDENGVTGLEKVIGAMMEAAQEGNVRATEFIRDTVGEKPADKQELTANIMTEADRAVLSNVAKRLNGDIEDED